MRKISIISIILAVFSVMLFCFSPRLYANNFDEIKVSINGNYLDFNNNRGSPYIANDTIMIPIRAIADALALDIKWIKIENKIVLKSIDKTLEYIIGKRGLSVNQKYLTTSKTPKMKNGRAYVPLKSLTENLNIKMNWDSTIKEASITVPEVGVNLSHIHYWSSQWMFKDAMKQSWYWWVQKDDGSTWDDKNIDIPMNKNGYPLEIPYNGYRVHTAVLMHLNEKSLYPKGEYTLRFKGSGEVLIYGDAKEKVYTEANKDHYLQVTPSTEGIHITILRSEKDDPIRNIQLMMPGFTTNEENPYHPDFIKHINPFKVIRFMKPTYIEDCAGVTWENRSTPSYMTQSHIEKGGLSHEYIVSLSNMYNKNPWINVPHDSSDDYVKQLALFYKEKLNNNLQLYIEYSNEPWNPLFQAYNYGIEKGESLSLGVGEEANARFNVHRTLEMRDIFKEVYGEAYHKRVTWILNTWSYRRDIGEIKLSELDKRDESVDVLAIAPYFGGEIANDIGDGYLMSNDEVFSRMKEELETEITEQIKWHKNEATKRSMRLITYEAGQHFVGLFYPWHEGLKKQMVEVNADPRMEEMYERYLNIWFNEASDLTVLFELVENSNDYGDFGLKRDYDSQHTPKWDAVIKVLNNKN